MVDYTFLKKWATLQSALHSNGPQAGAAEGMLYRAASSIGCHLLENQGTIIVTPPNSNQRWADGLLDWGRNFGAFLCRKGHTTALGTARPIVEDPNNSELIQHCNPFNSTASQTSSPSTRTQER